MKEEIPYSFYLWLQKKIVNKCNSSYVIKLKDAKECMRIYRIPKEIRPIIMKELQELKLIESVNRDYIKVINLKNNKIDKLNELYEARGFWTKLEY